MSYFQFDFVQSDGFCTKIDFFTLQHCIELFFCCCKNGSEVKKSSILGWVCGIPQITLLLGSTKPRPRPKKHPSAFLGLIHYQKNTPLLKSTTRARSISWPRSITGRVSITYVQCRVSMTFNIQN